jgi:holo-[acyl-carrier protein] synthase
MIAGIGIDSIEIARFAHWHCWPHTQLQRIFSQHEIDYCLAIPACSAQRFAVRFAAREALYKALTQLHPKHTMPFLTLCRATTIETAAHHPTLHLNTALLQPYGLSKTEIMIHLSLTHTKTIATAMIILEA